MPRVNVPWPLNSDLCTSNPLIMFILSLYPSVPLSCPSVQVSAASDLPVHHEVAFVQLWPRLLGHAALPQPLRCQDGPVLRSPWQPWLLTPHLLTSTTLNLHPANLRSQQFQFGSEFGAVLDTGWSLDLGLSPCGRPKQTRPYGIDKESCWA